MPNQIKQIWGGAHESEFLNYQAIPELLDLQVCLSHQEGQVL